MPIYVYQCQKCHTQYEILQKLSDKVIEQCPECSSKHFQKQVTAAGFTLKGTGWYATDFKNKPKPTTKQNSQSNNQNSTAAKENIKSESGKSSETNKVSTNIDNK